jgi:hypothetical protein
VNTDAREIARDEQFVELDCTSDRLHKNDDLRAENGMRSSMVFEQAHHDYLIEFQGVQQLIQLPVLTNLLKLDVVLLETVEGQFCFVVHENFERLSRNKINKQTATKVEHHDHLRSP